MKNKPSLVPPLRIHLAFDGSDHSMVAAQFVSDLPLPLHSRITILGVVRPDHSRYESRLGTALMQAEKILGRKAVETESVLLYGRVAKQLIEYGNEHRPDLMIIGAKGQHATLGTLLGGVAQQVVQHAHWPVLVARAPYHGLRRVLVAADGSPNSRMAAEYLAQFPLPSHTEIQVAHAQPLLLEELERFAYNKGPIAYLAPSMPLMADRPIASHRAELQKQRGRVILAEARGILEAAGHKSKGIILDGDPASQILEYAELKKVDLIVAGSRGLSRIEGWWWGSVSRKLVNYAHSSVLIVRSDAESTNPE